MRKLLLVAVPAGAVLVAAVLTLSTLRRRGDAADAWMERARLKREFVERAALLRALPADPPSEWREEVTALARRHIEALAEVRNRFPRAPAAPSAIEAAETERKGKLPEKDRDAILDFQRYAEGRFALLRDGSYAQIASAAAAGLRLDLVAIEPGASPDGAPGLRIDFALWGAPRMLERERSGDRIVTRTVVPVGLKKLTFRFLDDGGQLYGEMTGAGEPYQKLVDPERFVEDFPPGVLFGTWWVELLPREAVQMELQLEADVRGATGAVRPASFTLVLPVAEGWRIPPGASYQAEVREAAPAPGR
jgi:hypothetical protein